MLGGVEAGNGSKSDGAATHFIAYYGGSKHKYFGSFHSERAISVNLSRWYHHVDTIHRSVRLTCDTRQARGPG